MRARLTALGLTAALAVYLVILGQRAVFLLGRHQLVLRGLGLGVALVAVLGAVLVAAELRFGSASARLGRELGEDPAGLPAELPRTGGGRIDRAAADAVFEVRRRAVAAAPEDWRAWYRLGVAYGDAGDVRRGRAAVRRAVALHRGERAVLGE